MHFWHTLLIIELAFLVVGALLFSITYFVDNSKEKKDLTIAAHWMAFGWLGILLLVVATLLERFAPKAKNVGYALAMFAFWLLGMSEDFNG